MCVSVRVVVMVSWWTGMLLASEVLRASVRSHPRDLAPGPGEQLAQCIR